MESAIQAIPGMAGVVSRPPGIGRVFFVKIGGSDTNNGIDPGTPFLTIDHAIGQCDDDRNDYIYVLDCWDADAYPITIDKSRIHIIGVAVPSMNLFPQLQGGGADIFQLNDNYVEIAGFGFVSIGEAAIISGAAIPSYGWIHHCTFATAALSLENCIEQGASQIGNMLIEDNFFGSNITMYGLTGQFVNCIIRRNVFRDNHIIALNLGGVEIGAIYENYFYAKEADTPGIGWAITLAVNSNGGMIANNHAMQTGDGTGNNPYRDQSGNPASAMLNGWGMNYSGQAVIVPAT